MRETSDIETLQDEFGWLGRPGLPTAVMITRGDLTGEIGFGRLAEMQEEIL